MIKYEGSGNLEARGAYLRAERKIRARLGFYWHLLVFGTLNLFSIGAYLVNSLLSGHWIYCWLPWTFAGLSAVLLFHFLAVFVWNEDFQQRSIGRQLLKMGALDQKGEYGDQYLAAYRVAEQRMVARLGIYWHAASYLTLSFLCTLTYFLTSLHIGQFYYAWFVWPIAGLGAILFCHISWVLLFRSDFRQRRLEKELRP